MEGGRGYGQGVHGQVMLKSAVGQVHQDSDSSVMWLRSPRRAYERTANDLSRAHAPSSPPLLPLSYCEPISRHGPTNAGPPTPVLLLKPHPHPHLHTGYSRASATGRNTALRLPPTCSGEGLLPCTLRATFRSSVMRSSRSTLRSAARLRLVRTTCNSSRARRRRTVGKRTGSYRMRPGELRLMQVRRGRGAHGPVANSRTQAAERLRYAGTGGQCTAGATREQFSSGPLCSESSPPGRPHTHLPVQVLVDLLQPLHPVACAHGGQLQSLGDGAPDVSGGVVVARGQQAGKRPADRGAKQGGREGREIGERSGTGNLEAAKWQTETASLQRARWLGSRGG